MSWWNEFNSTFWLTIAGVMSGLVGVLVRACIKSKCSQIDCLGFRCIRDTAAEVELEEHAGPQNNLTS